MRPGMVVHYGQRWMPRRWHALCLGRHVFTRRTWLSPTTLAHEAWHVAQYGVYGVVGYLVRWFWWTWRFGYWRNPLEQQARDYAAWHAADYGARHERDVWQKAA